MTVTQHDIRKPLMIGGQAVIEGVMMRGPGVVATAVRRRDGSITVKKEPFVAVAERFRLLKLPLVRGAVGLIEMLVIGIRTLNYSAEVALLDETASENRKNGNAAAKKKDRTGGISLGITVAVAFLLGIAVFFGLPLIVTTAFFSIDQQPFWFNVVAGVIRMSLFLAYLGAIAQLADVKRLFAYHGAEHKAVFAYEAGRPLSVDSAAVESRFHPRCGTSFVLVVMLVAIMLFAILDAMLISWFGTVSLPLRIATHLPMLPLVGGLAYEFIRISARRSATAAGRLIVAPGLWLQRITTREPDRTQLEVAIAALSAALGEEEPVPAAQAISVN